jgi:hypothetical protein
VHLVRVPAEMEGVLESAAGNDVEVEVDWERRMDHVSEAWLAFLGWICMLRSAHLCIPCCRVFTHTALFSGCARPPTRQSWSLAPPPRVLSKAAPLPASRPTGALFMKPELPGKPFPCRSFECCHPL